MPSDSFLFASLATLRYVSDVAKVHTSALSEAPLEGFYQERVVALAKEFEAIAASLRQASQPTLDLRSAMLQPGAFNPEGIPF